MASTAVDRIIMPFRVMPLVLFLTLMHRPSLGQRDNGQPWQSTRRGRFQAYKHLQSPLAREPVVSCAPPPSPQHNSRDCKSASHGRAEGAFKRSLGNIFPLHEARATGARAIYLDIGARHPFPTKQHPKQASLPYFTRLYPGGTTVLGLDTVGGGTMKRHSTRTYAASLHKVDQRYERRKRPACTARLRAFRYLDRLLTPPSCRVTARRRLREHSRASAKP